MGTCCYVVFGNKLFSDCSLSTVAIARARTSLTSRKNLPGASLSLDFHSLRLDHGKGGWRREERDQISGGFALRGGGAHTRHHDDVALHLGGKGAERLGAP